MGAMGPEGALLSGQLARYGTLRAYSTLEYPQENDWYIAGAVEASREHSVALPQLKRPSGAWSRLRTAIRRGLARDVPVRGITEFVPGRDLARKTPEDDRRTVSAVYALPIAGIGLADPGESLGGGKSPIASLPLYHDLHR